MNGKKVDVEKGSVLKAEMAKKNLHIKRNSIVPSTTTSTSTTATLLPSAVFLPEPSSSPMTILSRRLSQAQAGDIMPAFSSPPHPTAGFSPLPKDLLSPGDYKHDPFLSENMITTPNTPSFNDSLFGIPSLSLNGRDNSNSFAINNHDSGAYPFPFFTKTSFTSEIDTDPFSYMSKSTPVPHHDLIQSGFYSGNNGDDLMLLGRKNSLQPPSNNNKERSGSISSFRTLLAASNPADQNPPCNTLYVGNLPPATNEDELRSLFANCEGYKRMCFRNKPQGPMCFVEFDDVIYATQAMNEYQGNVLSNSIKGGIRLSFSKNPLFIKPSKEASIAFNFKQMGTALLADL